MFTNMRNSVVLAIAIASVVLECCYKSCLIIHTSGGNNCLNLPLVIRYGVDNFTLCYVTSNAETIECFLNPCNYVFVDIS